MDKITLWLVGFANVFYKFLGFIHAQIFLKIRIVGNIKSVCLNFLAKIII